MEASAQMAKLSFTEGIKKNINGLSSAFLKLEFNNAQNAKDTPARGVAEKAIKAALPKNQAGLLVTDALDNALQECRKKVDAIVQRCHMTNRKFRDIDFDLEKNQFLYRFGLEGTDEPYTPCAVKRVTDIFEKPVFFGPDGPKSSDVRQGDLGNCWFLAALSAISTVEGLVQKICVARNEEVGVYGFVFFRDSVWKTVIVDDLLFWSMPKYDELTMQEKQLYHEERETYHQVVERSGKGLLYARSGVIGETWVPLIEKAYAKLHGDYSALEGGWLSEGIEDLTGGVATSFQMSDLLSKDRFWADELQHADNHTRLFGVGLTMDEARSKEEQPNVQGLWPAHAYSVLRARECMGKRFVVVRNPWGNSEWSGAWADGAKEWKGKWLQALGELGHEFGDDGQFVMEYSDFLSVFQTIDRATLFDSSWVMSSYWLRVPPQPALHPWTYGDVYYYIKLDKASSTMIVLAQIDDRYFKGLQGTDSQWYLDFAVFRRDTAEPVGLSGISLGSQRSVSCEIQLEEGEYIVVPRVEPMYRGVIEFKRDDDTSEWSRAKLSRVLAERAESRLIAANYELWQEIDKIPRTQEVALEVDLNRVDASPPEDDEPTKSPATDAGRSPTEPDDSETEQEEPSSPTEDTETSEGSNASDKGQSEDEEDVVMSGSAVINASRAKAQGSGPKNEHGSPPALTVTIDGPLGGGIAGSPPPSPSDGSTADSGPSSQPLFLGLRVYTRDGAVAIVSGRLNDA